MSSDSAPRSSNRRAGGGRNGPRSRSGCWTCRSKKVKCDEVRPQCRRCGRLKLLCDYEPRARAGRGIARQLLQMSRDATDGEPGADGWLSWDLSSQSLFDRGALSTLSAIRLPAPATGACSLDLTAADHEAIRYFRLSFAKLHHTKNPDYSVFSIMFSLAQVDPIVMHMILAIASRETEFRRNKDADDAQVLRKPLAHYSTALRMMADAIGKPNHQQFDLDCINTVLYLMLLYEQKYGDEKCLGMSNHLNGASLILVHGCGERLRLSTPSSETRSKGLALMRRSHNTDGNQALSFYSARLLVWIALYDASAASFGVGGELNEALYRLSGPESNVDSEMKSSLNSLETFDRLHRFSNPLYRTMWGENYPQSELLDDVENRSIYSLLGACGQLRVMISQLAVEYRTNSPTVKKQAAEVEMSIMNVGNRFGELIEVAAGLSVQTDNSHRLVDNIRCVVPYYHAVILDFLRIKHAGDSLTLSVPQRNALREIMNLSFQAYKHGGEEAMLRIAWPLFMVAIETDDLLHRDWVLDRFRAMRMFGKNFDRAHKFLLGVVEAQTLSGKRTDVRERLQSGEADLFVI